MTARVTAEHRAAVQPNSGPEPTSGTPGHGDAPGSSAGARTAVSDSVRRRLRSMPARGWRSWVAAAWVVAIAAILRFVNLGLPDKLIFLPVGLAL